MISVFSASLYVAATSPHLRKMLELHGLELKLLCRRIGDADNVIETTLTCATEEQPSMSVNESTIRRPNTFPGIICKLTGVSLIYIYLLQLE